VSVKLILQPGVAQSNNKPLRGFVILFFSAKEHGFLSLCAFFEIARTFGALFLENREKSKNKMFFSQKVQFCAKKCAEKVVL